MSRRKTGSIDVIYGIKEGKTEIQALRFPKNSWSPAGARSNNLQTSASFDFETQNSYVICIRATDSTNLTYDEQITVTITDVNEAPTDIAFSPSSVAENQPVNTVVGALSTTDVDAGDSHTYSLVVNPLACPAAVDNASFNISGSNLQTSAIFDFETQNSYVICIQTTDSGALTFDKQFAVTVTNVNDPPVITEGTSVTVNMSEDGSPTPFSLTLNAIEI